MYCVMHVVIAKLVYTGQMPCKDKKVHKSTCVILCDNHRRMTIWNQLNKRLICDHKLIFRGINNARSYKQPNDGFSGYRFSGFSSNLGNGSYHFIATAA